MLLKMNVMTFKWADYMESDGHYHVAQASLVFRNTRQTFGEHH